MLTIPPDLRGQVLVIDLQDERYWSDFPMCGEYRRLDHAVAWYCGPIHDEIGSITTEYIDGGVVGGMSVCKGCHDRHYLVAPAAR